MVGKVIPYAPSLSFVKEPNFRPGPDLHPLGHVKLYIKYIDESGRFGKKRTAKYEKVDDIYRVTVDQFCRFMSAIEADTTKLTLADGLTAFEYNRLRKQLACKLIFIVTLQNMLYKIYNRKLPTWFNKPLKSVFKAKKVEDYFTKAQKIFNCIMLYKHHDDKEYDLPGHLVTSGSLKRAGWVLNEKKRRRTIKFKDLNTLTTQCKLYGGKGDLSIFEIMDIVLQKGKQIEFFEHMQCQRELNYMQRLFTAVLTSPHLYIETLMGIGCLSVGDAYAELKKMAETSKVSQRHYYEAVGCVNNYVEKSGKAGVDSSATNKLQDRTQSRRQLVEDIPVKKETVDLGDLPADLVKVLSTKKERFRKAINRIMGDNVRVILKDGNVIVNDKPVLTFSTNNNLAQAVKKLNDTPNPSTQEEAERAVLLSVMDFLAAMDAGKYVPYWPRIQEIFWEYAWEITSSGKTNFGDRLRYRGHGPFRSGFGSGRGGQALANFIGYVKPYDISMAEQYTGMTPQMYRSHIQSNTATPYGSKVPIAQANSYYGSYGLGESLNPTRSSFGARRQQLYTDGKKVYRISNGTASGKKRRNRFGDNFFF